MPKPEDIFHIRKGSGHGAFTVSIKPERLQEATRAMFVLMSKNPFKTKSEVVVDVLIQMARLIEEDPDLAAFLEGEFAVDGDGAPLRKLQEGE